MRLAGGLKWVVESCPAKSRSVGARWQMAFGDAVGEPGFLWLGASLRCMRLGNHGVFAFPFLVRDFGGNLDGLQDVNPGFCNRSNRDEPGRYSSNWLSLHLDQRKAESEKWKFES
jgi:hypothetical protein